MTRIGMTPRCVVLAAGLLLGGGSLQAGSLGVVTAPRGDGELSRHAAAVAGHARDTHSATVLDHSAMTAEEWGALNVKTLWWHHVDGMELPEAMTDPGVVAVIREFVEDGGGLLLSGYAVQYAVDLGLEAVPPSGISHEPAIAEDWGFRAIDPGHPVFTGLESPIITVSTGVRADNFVAWWDDPASFSGTWLADLDWGGGKVAIGEYTLGGGHVLVCGAGAFNWGSDGRPNAAEPVLHQLTANMLRHLGVETEGPERSTGASIMASLSGEGKRIALAASDPASAGAQAASAWIQEHVSGSSHSIAGLMDDPALLDGVDVLWWHEEDFDALPPAESGLYTALENRVAAGMGLFLSGFAPMTTVPLGIESTMPTSVFNDPGRSGNWGYTPVCTSHPVMQDFSGPFRTLSAGLDVGNVLCWWDDPADFSGTWLADNESGIGKVAMGAYRHGLGRVIVTGSGAFDWATGHANAHRGQLELLTARIFEWIASPSPSEADDPHLLAWWDFDGEGPEVRNRATGYIDRVTDIVDSPERRDGPVGRALFLDGFSNWVNAGALCGPGMTSALSMSAWVAVEAYPPQDAGFLSQFDDHSGFFFGVTPFGEWGIRVKTRGKWQTLWAPERLDTSRWAHVAATISAHDGSAALFLDGEKVAESRVLEGSIDLARGVPLSIARASDAGYVVDLFRTGVVRGMMDEVKVWSRMLDAGEVRREFERGAPPRYPDVSTFPKRLAEDPHRPVYHPIPEGSWANEPHGLIQAPDGRYYMSYQKNPAGPYWAHIHWGNMASDDLLHWEHLPIALAPEPGLDQAGVWSGHAIMWDDKLTLVYTGVDGRRAVVALATETDGTRRHFEKHPANPVIDGRPRGLLMEDYRDPFVWEEDGTWYLLIGAGLPGIGGTVLLYRSVDFLSWEYLGRFKDGDRENSGFYWEMPVFLPMGDRYWFGISELPGRNSWWTGTWEDEVFTPDFEHPRRLEIINHFLSPTVTQDDQGRTVAIGIIPETRSSEEQHRAGWAHVFSLPRLWSIDANGEFLQEPLPDLETLRGPEMTSPSFTATPGGVHLLEGITGDTIEIDLDLEFAGAEAVTIHLRRSPGGEEETLVTYRPGEGELLLDRTRSSGNMEVQRDVRRGDYVMQGDRLHARLFLDRSVLEGFLDGRGTFTTRIYPLRPDAVGVGISAEGGDVIVHSARAWEMTPTVGHSSVSDAQ